METVGTPDYRRLRPETPDQSTDGSNIVENQQDGPPPVPSRVHLPTKTPTVRYVPDSGWSRYWVAVKSLVPFRRTRGYSRAIPVDQVGLFSYATFNWLWSTVGEIDDTNLPTCSSFDSCDINGQRLHYIWREEVVHTGQLATSMFTVMWKFVRTRVIIAVLIYVLGVAFSVQGPVICLKGFLFALSGSSNTNDGNYTNETATEDIIVMDPKIEALIWAVGLVVTELVSVLLIAWSLSIVYRTATRLRSASMALIYKKLVHLSNLNIISTQQMVSLLGTDGQKLYEAVSYGFHIITAPIVFLYCIVSCTFILTSSSLDVVITMSVFLITCPLLYVLVRLASHLGARATAFCTQRLRLVHEMLVHIRLVKMTIWEGVLWQRLKGTRRQELGCTRRQYLCDGFCTSVIHVIPVVALVLFLSSNTNACLKASEVFPVLALFFGHMKDSLYRFWLGMKKVSDAFQSLERFKTVMLLIQANTFAEKPINPLMALNISNATFVWDSVGGERQGQQPTGKRKKNHSKRKVSHRTLEMQRLAEVNLEVKPALVDITLLAPKGKLIGICGAPKCGKSSLLLAVLGHLREMCGQVLRDGNCAYVGQRPWIWTASIRDNIVFKEPFQHKRYYSAVHNCALNEDIDKLPHHDDTQIDETGLSPGQRQRIALARALYSNRDIYLLDNPLSMVDADTAAVVFDRCILKALHGRTVILATQQVQFMTRCDEVYLMSNGKIVQSGTHEWLMQHSPEYSSLIKACTHENAKKYFVETSRRHIRVSSMTEFISQYIIQTDNTSVGPCHNNGEDVDHLDLVDLRPLGSVRAYVASFGSVCSYVWMMCGLLSQLLYSACLFGIPIYMLLFQSCGRINFISLNAALLVLMCISGLAWSFSFTTTVVGVSERAHNSWFKKLCRAPVGYFQASSAMICVLNFFSLNVQDIDMKLPLSIELLLQSVSFFFCAMFALLYISPYSLAVVLFAVLISVVILGRPHRNWLLKLHGIEELSRIPLYQHVVTTITGRTTIQAFAKDKDFIADFTNKCDDNATCIYLLSAASCWLAIRVQFIAAVTTGLVAVVLVFTKPVFWIDHQHDDYIAGFALVITMQLGSWLQCILQSVAESEARLRTFAESSRCIQGIESEEETMKTKQKLLPANWPTDGSITFEDVETVESPVFLQGLKGMSFEITTGQKIGVVGLPGSGKKLLVDTLFRLVGVKHGRVLIGGTDLTYVPLQTLRSRMAIVSQDPVLFAGTIRLNIDPRNIYSDLQIWESLQKVNLQERIERLPHQLNTRVDRNGDKLSVGERQLLSLARAWLRNIKVLVLEEPQATFGEDLDAVLNHVAWNLFPTATVLTIAHQIKYVVHCDKIMVVDGGKVVEFDIPSNLYRNRQSYLSRMISASMGDLFETEL